MVQQHNKIINTVAKRILSPQGLFSVGSSRRWLDDNGYFMVQIEFQPSGYTKGSYLNVGISFLWEATEALNDTLKFDYGYREKAGKKSFDQYRGDDDAFDNEIEQFAKVALEKVIEYRQFKDMNYAKKQLKNQVENLPETRRFWELYNLTMLCFLKRDFEEGTKYFSEFLQFLKNSFYAGELYVEWREKFYNHCIEYILPKIVSEEAAHIMVLEMIERRRNFFCNKSTYKKMKKDFII